MTSLLPIKKLFEFPSSPTFREARFGPQEMVDEVKPLVARLLKQSQEAQKP
jgi:hypothetical protein